MGGCFEASPVSGMGAISTPETVGAFGAEPSVRASISATPGIASGGRTVTNSRYGPALPSAYTSGLPTCAHAGTEQDKTTVIAISRNFADHLRRLTPGILDVERSALKVTHPPSQQDAHPGAQECKEHGQGQPAPEGRAILWVHEAAKIVEGG